MTDAVFLKIDCHMLAAADLDAAIDFYQNHLGQALIWRSEEAAGFRMPETDAEIVVHKRLAPETDLLVKSVPEAVERLIAAGAHCLAPPFDIAIGKCAVMRDPFGNVLTILDQSKGQLKTDAAKNVVARTEVAS
jgi:predicted enzyme related to lactoylglutathione lyase